jgi:hypothetical protein
MQPELLFRSARGKPTVYIERGSIDRALTNALAIDRHLVLYGPVGQGKGCYPAASNPVARRLQAGCLTARII